MNIGKKLYEGFWAGFATIGILVLLSGIVSANGELSVVNLGISPQPVIAGQNATITFQLYDSYGALSNVNFGLAGSYPLLNYSPIDTQLISSMSQGVYNGQGSYFKYQIHIPQNVQSGTYTLYVDASYLLTSTTNGESTVESASSSMPITLYISGIPQLVLSAVPQSQIVPGSQFDVDIDALNTGTAEATNVSLTLVGNANFSVSGASAFNLGAIQASGSAVGYATLEANSTLTQGSSYIPVILRYTTQYGANVTRTVSVPISVLVEQPNLVASITASQPQTLYAGSNQTLTVSIQNIGTGVAKNITAMFLSTSNLTVGNSASSDFIGTIDAGSSVSQSVFVIADKKDNLTNYALPVRFTYSNANYQSSIEKTGYLNVTLQRSAIYNITNVTDSLQPGATYAPISFTVKNTGGESAQQVTFSLQTIYPISPVNPNVYVTQLAPGQSRTITFYVNVDTQGSLGNYPVTLYEQWTQPNGATSQQYSGSNNYYASVYGSGSGAGGTTAAIVVVVVLVIVVAVLYRRGIIKLPMQAKKKEKPKQ